MSYSQQLGAPDRKEVSAGSVDQKLDVAQRAAFGTVAVKAKGLRGMVTSFSRKAMNLLSSDVSDLAKQGGAYLANDAKKTAGHAAAIKDAVVGSAKSAAGAVRDVKAGLGSLARNGVLATGMAGAMVAPAFGEEAPSATDGKAYGAKTELASPLAAGATTETVLLAKNDLPADGNREPASSDSGTAETTPVPAPAPARIDAHVPAPRFKFSIAESETALDAIIKSRSKDPETVKLLESLRAKPGSLAQGIRDTIAKLEKSDPEAVKALQAKAAYQEVMFYDLAPSGVDGLLDPLNKSRYLFDTTQPALDFPALRQPVEKIFPAKFRPLTSENLADFLKWCSVDLRFAKPVVADRIKRGDPFYALPDGSPNKDAILALRADLSVAALGGESSTGPKKGYLNALREPAVLPAYLEAMNATISALVQRGGELPVDVPWKLAAHVGTLTLASAGKLPQNMTDADYLQLSDEFGFLARFAPYLRDERPAGQEPQPIAELLSVSRPEPSVLDGVKAAVGEQWYRENVYNATFVAADPADPGASELLHTYGQYKVTWELAPAILVESAKLGSDHRAAAVAALKTVSERVRPVSVWLGDFDLSDAQAYHVRWTPALEKAAAEAPRRALNHIVTSQEGFSQSLTDYAQSAAEVTKKTGELIRVDAKVVQITRLNDSANRVRMALAAWKEAISNHASPQEVVRLAETLRQEVKACRVAAQTATHQDLSQERTRGLEFCDEVEKELHKGS